MEFAMAVFSAAASAAASSAVLKLGGVISTKLKGKTKTDATYIKDELQWIQSAVIPRLLAYALVHPRVEGLHKLRRLKRLAYEIEDCLDCFQVKKMRTEEFAKEVAELKKKSEEMHKQLLEHLQIEKEFRELALTSSAQGQGQQPATEVPVPQEIQELLGQQSKDNLTCLLYFCMFPHDHHARRNPLIRRWMAEGLAQGEDAAVKYLETLIDSNIITSTAKSNNGMMKRCQPPGEIHRFIKEQSSSTDFMLFCDDMARLEAECARRLSLHPNEDTLDDLNLPDYSNLHTLAVFYGGANPEAILKPRKRHEIKYEVLRVLDLKECAPLCDLSAICKLLLLKYLSFRFQIQSGADHHLPSEIGKLEWLETLDLSGSGIVTVTPDVLTMPKLKHLLGKFQLSRWESLNMTSSKIFEWKTGDLKEFLKKKSVLQTLSGFVTGKRLGFPQLMSAMRKLKKVKIWCKSNASEANLDDISGAIKKFIRDGIQESDHRSLSIDFKDCSRQFLNTLQAEGSLTSLKLHGDLSEFPQFVAQLGGIKELCLSSTALSWEKILAGLSNLGVLKYLKLVEDKLEHVKILTEHLRSLERLCLVCVQGLDIKIQAGALPNLVSLHIICQSLDVLPGTPDMEITRMAALQEVGLHPQVDQAIKQGWKNAAEAHPNKPSVLDVHIP